MIRIYHKTKRLLILFLIITAMIAWSVKDDYQKVDLLNPATFSQPVQTEIKDAQPITFGRDSYQYTLTPLHDYEINAFVLSALTYKEWYALYKRDSTFPKDLCLTWGANVEKKYFQDENITFSQDSRWCRYYSKREVPMHFSEISNNHLLPKDETVERAIMQIDKGDQVRIKGKLVNVDAVQDGELGDYDPSQFNLKTSTQRSDSGAGACEIIYVEEIEIIAKGHPLAHNVFSYSVYAVLALLVLSVLEIIFLPVDIRKHGL